MNRTSQFNLAVRGVSYLCIFLAGFLFHTESGTWIGYLLFGLILGGVYVEVDHK